MTNPMNDFNAKIIEEFPPTAARPSSFRAATCSSSPRGRKSAAKGPPLVYSKTATARHHRVDGRRPEEPPGTQSQSQPEVTLEVAKTSQAKASTQKAQKRERLYAQQAAMMPAFTSTRGNDAEDPGGGAGAAVGRDYRSGWHSFPLTQNPLPSQLCSGRGQGEG